MASKHPRLIVRPCFQQDLQFVQLIYSHAVETGTGTFETEAPSLEEMTRRWTNIVDRGWPFMVASPPEDVSRVLAFAYAVQYRDRAAYEKDLRGLGIYSAHGRSPRRRQRGAC
ncbi:MAG: hypothetical protein IPG56_09190 [Caulobacteraceae bacterium]|nr:hypothetical protein [Caulobacteraceae bacterium]